MFQYSIRFNEIGPLLGKIYVRTLEDNKELSKLARECVILLLAVLDCTKNESVKIEDIEHEISNVDDFDVENSLIVSYVDITCSVCFNENIICDNHLFYRLLTKNFHQRNYRSLSMV